LFEDEHDDEDETSWTVLAQMIRAAPAYITPDLIVDSSANDLRGFWLGSFRNVRYDLSLALRRRFF